MDKIHRSLIECDVPVLYATTEGQTRRIAMRLAEALRKRGVDGRPIDIRSPAADRVDWSRVRAAIVGASIHVGRHQREAASFVREHAAQLNAHPSVFFSVSLSAASKQPREVQAATDLAEAFPAALDWHPDAVRCFAGRLAYKKYGFFKRLLMKLIARKEGASTDTSRDHELTNWDDVERLADEVRALVEKQVQRSGAA